MCTQRPVCIYVSICAAYCLHWQFALLILTGLRYFDCIYRKPTLTVNSKKFSFKVAHNLGIRIIRTVSKKKKTDNNLCWNLSRGWKKGEFSETSNGPCPILSKNFIGESELVTFNNIVLPWVHDVTNWCIFLLNAQQNEVTERNCRNLFCYHSRLIAQKSCLPHM